MIKNNNKLAHIPGDIGSFIFGNTFSYLSGPLKFSQERVEKYGSIFKYRFFFENCIMMNSPDAAEFVLMDKDRLFSSKKGYQKIFEPFLRNGLMLKDFDEHKIHRKYLQPAFTSEKIKYYIPIITKTVDKEMMQLPDNGQLLCYPFVKKLTLSVAAALLLGVDIEQNIDLVNQAFVNTLRACFSFIKFDMPGTSFHKGLKSRAYLSEYISQSITKKILQPGHDMLSNLVGIRDDNGERMSHQEIIDHMIFILTAAHDTSTITISVVLYMLARHPEWQNNLFQEMQEFDIEHQELTIDILDKLTQLDLVVNECLRMFPPSQGIARKSIQSFEFGGHSIPKDTTVYVNILMTNMLSEYWSCPEKFDPERFNDERAEHKQHRFLFLPFGGGAHKCIGMHMAQFQIKTIVAKLLIRYRFSLINDNYTIVRSKLTPFFIPADNLPLIITKR